VTLPCTRFAKTAKFYGKTLGLKSSGKGPGRVVLDLETVRLVLVDASRMSGFSRGDGQGLYMEITIVDLPATRARLEAAGVRLFAPRRSRGDVLTVEDPEGNLVNLVAAPAAG
jgi:catechol-2,3-dioxygenase